MAIRSHLTCSLSIAAWLGGLSPVVGDELPQLDPMRLKRAAATFGADCALCHDEDATGFGEVRLNLVDRNWHHGGELADIEKTIREGIPDTDMEGNKDRLTKEEIEDLAKYVLLLVEKKHIEVPGSSRPAASRLTDEVTASSAVRADETITAAVEKNFIDDFIFGKMESDGIPHAEVCTDAEFVRRLYLDLWGRLPDSSQVRAFLADEDPEKRNKLIDELLGLDYAHKPGEKGFKSPSKVGEPFLSKWRYYFEDLFRNYSECFLDTDAFRTYLHGVLKANVPYDVVVRDMLTTTTFDHSNNGAAGFLVRQAPFAGSHEDACDENAVYVTRNFLGVNLQCISCHDGHEHLEGINLWLSRKRRLDFWNQAAFFGNTRIFRPGGGAMFYVLFDAELEADPDKVGDVGARRLMSEFEFDAADPNSIRTAYNPAARSTLRVPRNKNADIVPTFILDGRTPAPGANPRQELANMITSSFQFAKVTVNIIWAQLMTVGIVDPPLDWDLARQDPDNPPPAPWELQPSHPELLDALAKDFQEHDFDLRYLMRTICRSKAYQLSSRFEGEYKPEYDRYYARKLVRRLWAQEIYDAVLKATTVQIPEENYAMNSKGPVRDVIPYHDKDISRFLNAFGQSNRDTKEADTQTISIVQVATLLNSNVVKNKVLASRPEGRVNKLLQDHPSSTWDKDGTALKSIVEELFLSSLSRFPSDEEMLVALDHLRQHRDVGVENLQWALINKVEFIVNR